MIFVVLVVLAGEGAGGPRVVGSDESTAAAVPAASGAAALFKAELVSLPHTQNTNSTSRHLDSAVDPEVQFGKNQSTDGDMGLAPHWLGGQHHTTSKVQQSTRAPLTNADAVEKTVSGGTEQAASATSTARERERPHKPPVPNTRRKRGTLTPSETEVTTERVNGRWLVMLDVCVDHDTAVAMIASMCERVGSMSVPRAWHVAPR